MGFTAGYSNTTGAFSTFVGYQTGYYSTGTYNNIFGTQAGFNLSTGGYNTCVGGAAGYNMTTGSGNIAIGGQTSAGTYVPVQSITTQNDYISMGSTSATNAYIQVAWTVVSDLRDKIVLGDVPLGLDFVRKLKPIKYQFTETRGDNTPHGDVKYGFGAQDVLAEEGDNPVIVDTKVSDKLKITDSHMMPVFANAIKEMADMIDQLKAEIAALKGA